MTTGEIAGIWFMVIFYGSIFVGLTVLILADILREVIGDWRRTRRARKYTWEHGGDLPL